MLILGETGVGKELVAAGVHRASERSGPLVTVNVAGLDSTAFSDTLFGHKKGAFTGTDQDRGGLVERVADGTLLGGNAEGRRKNAERGMAPVQPAVFILHSAFPLRG